MSVLDFCFQTNSDFLREKQGAYLVLLQRKYDLPELRSLLQDPDRFLENSELLKDSRTTKAGIVSVGSRRFFLKRYNNKGLKFTLRYLIRKPRAFRAWQAAWFLRRLNIPTPANFATASLRSGPVLKCAYLITEYLDETVSTLDFFRIMAGSPETAELLIENTMRFLAPLHNWGIRHRDLKLSNVYIQSSAISKQPGGGSVEPKYSFGLWDLDGLKITRRPLSLQERADDIARLPASFKEIGERLELNIKPEVVTTKIRETYEYYSGFPVDMVTLSARENHYLAKSARRKH